MGRLAIILGSGTPDLPIEADAFVINRHGASVSASDHWSEPGNRSYARPHEIDHEGNLRAIVEAGCDRVLAISSVGGLKPELGPGTMLCPDDFIALQGTQRSALEGAASHRVPGFDPPWRGKVMAAFSADVPPVRDGGVYWQAPGPRLETRAEVGLISAHADVIGMTLASECIIAGELDLAYAAICMVDNLANGVAGSDLTLEELEANRVANMGLLEAALAQGLPQLV
jgi:5'-methylthioadenosine phosphorylase